MKHTTKLLYGIGGLIAGILITACYFCLTSATRGQRMMGGYHLSQSGEMMHHWSSDGSMIGASTGVDMDGAMDQMMTGLDGKTGDAFDQEFLSEMIVHHQGAVVMAQAVLKNSKRPELIKLANDIISAQTKEVALMKNWQKAWFKIQN